MEDPFMAEPIPKTIPRSTLACPPAKNFIDQYNKTPGQQSSAKLPAEKLSKNDSGRDLNLKATTNQKPTENFASTGTNFRTSSKDLKQSSNKNIPVKS